MIRSKLLVSALLMTVAIPLFSDVPYRLDPMVTEVGREYPRTEFTSFDSKELALLGEYESSPYYSSLNGVWKFLYAEDSRNIPSGVENSDYDVSTWNDIKVPGNWERQGFGTAIYVNQPYEFQYVRGELPQLPDVIPAGVYRREFTIPKEWKDKEIFLNLDGAKSGIYVYINGKEVGYSEDSKDRAQFSISQYLNDKCNTIVIKAYRWSSGTWLECQDFWRISGIEREVYLTAQPKVSLKDFRIISTLDDALDNGVFKLDMTINNKERKSINVAYELIDKSGVVVASESRVVDDVLIPSKEWKAERNVTFRAKIAQVKKWSAEEPNLYTLVMKVDGEYIPYRVGFRKIEISDGLLLFNGSPIKFKGVNIHEHDQITGHYTSKETLRKDLELMRLNNINAIRTSHYPQPRYFYELCDEIGMYVYCEANIESHGMGYNLRAGGTLANNRNFYATHMDRIINMYERCKNFPSVTILSLGNEAGNGYNMYRAYEWIEEREKGENGMNRPICNERALLEWNTDMYVPQYPTAKWFEEIGENGCDRPVVPSEYSHAMGNSNGGLFKQWQSIRLYPQLQGGFIWDWVDQGFYEEDADGVPYWAYGGDYGVNPPSDANFCCNGLVAPDRTPHPALTEVKHSYSNIVFESSEEAFYVSNLFYFTDLSKYNFSYVIEENGKAIRRGKLNFSTQPQRSESFTISYKGIRFKDNADYYIRFSASTKSEERMIPAGYEVAFGQFPLSLSKNALQAPFKMKNGSTLSISENEFTIDVSSNKLNLRFDKTKGYVTSLYINGKEQFADGFGIMPNFWRAPLDNDYGNAMNRKLSIWKDASSSFDCKASVAAQGDNVLLTVQYKLPASNLFTVVYTITPTASIHIDTKFEALTKEDAVKNVPRIGVRFRMPLALDSDTSDESFTYFGRGPAENYCDRKWGSAIGLYSTTASSGYFPYVRPQECGHHCDVRFIIFKGMSIVADDVMEFNVLRHSVEDLDLGQQTHINDVTGAVRDFMEVCLDYRQMGVGGYDSWGAVPDEEAMIKTDVGHNWGFTIYFR